MDYLDEPIGRTRFQATTWTPAAMENPNSRQREFLAQGMPGWRSAYPNYGPGFGDPMNPMAFDFNPVNGGRLGDIRSVFRLPTVNGGDADDPEYKADMMIRQQLDSMKRSLKGLADPNQTGLMIDDMNSFKEGYRSLKGSGWDPGRAASAALTVGHAFGNNADFVSRVERMDDLANQRGMSIGDVSRQINRHRLGFQKQYAADLGFVNGCTPNYLNNQDIDDEFSAAYDAIRDVEDRFNYVFDEVTYDSILRAVSKSSAALSKYGSSSRDIGMDRVVEAAMYEVGALQGGDPAKNPLRGLNAGLASDKDGIGWSNFDFFPADERNLVPGQDRAAGYGDPQGKAGQNLTADDQDFGMTRGIREAFMKHRVRNLRNGSDAGDFGNTELLRDDIVDALKASSMTTKGLTDEDFGQLADAIIRQRSNGERVSITDTVKDMLYAPQSDDGLSYKDRRNFSRTVTGAWGNPYTKALMDFKDGHQDPASRDQVLKVVNDCLRTSGMSQDVQDMVSGMTKAVMDAHAYKVKEHIEQAVDDEGHSKPQAFQHTMTQLAQASQLVSYIDACRQGKVISEEDAKQMLGMIWDRKDPGKINLGVLHNVDAGFLHNSERDTRSNWLLQTDRPWDSVDIFGDTKVRAKNSDPLELIFNRLNDALGKNDAIGLGDVKDAVGRTVKAMDTLRAVYDEMEKDSNGYLRSSHVLTPDKGTAGLRDREDVPAGLLLGLTIPKWLGGGLMPDWLSGRGRLKFDKGMEKFNRAMDELHKSGVYVPGMDQNGYSNDKAQLKLSANWDSPSLASIRAGRSGEGRPTLYGVDPAKAQAWADWTRNQTMDTAEAKQMVDKTATGILRTYMKKFPGVSENDPRYQQVRQNIRRWVRQQFIAGKTIGGIDDLSGMTDTMFADAAMIGTKPNDGRQGKMAFGGDFQMMQELNEMIAPLQEAGDREFTMLQQVEGQQQLLAADELRRMAIPEDDQSRFTGLTPEQIEAVKAAEKIAGKPLTPAEQKIVLERQGGKKPEEPPAPPAET